MSSAENPLYDQTMLTTGMSMFGKISVGMRMTASGPRMKSSTASTMKVYGRRSASLTIHMVFFLTMAFAGGCPGAGRG